MVFCFFKVKNMLTVSQEFIWERGREGWKRAFLKKENEHVLRYERQEDVQRFINST